MSTYAYLGPVGTFTEAALKKITSASDALIPYSNVTAALDAVRDGKAEKVLVPIENSVEGVVSRTLDELAVGTPLVVTAETTLPVSFSLMVLPENVGKPITKIATHPHAEAQCRSFVAKNYPQAEVIEMSSTAAAAKGLSKGNYDAAIASEIAAENYGLKVPKALEEYDNNRQVNSFIEIIKEALETKRNIIEMDEFDEGKRKILNFGHTFGHVFESLSDLKINHGLAVGLGILSAIEFNNSINLFR